MSGQDRSNLVRTVATVIARLDAGEPALPKSLASDAKTFRAAAEPFLAAASNTAEKSDARDGALEVVGDADAVLDRAIDALADALVGAGLGKRKNPFKGYSKYAPSELQQLAYQKEVNATSDLLKAIAKAKPPASVKTVAAAVQKDAAAVQEALDALTAPEAAYVKARTKRDGSLAGVARATSRFKLKVKAACADEPETYAALFAAASPVQEPKAKRAPKKAAPAPSGGAASASGGAPATTDGATTDG